jgi:ubiquinone/menaquinone biosynthesis C-methylase UbiE
VTRSPGEVYQQEMVPASFARWAPDLVALAAIRPGERVLDVACGTGVVTRLAAERAGDAGRVAGIDINPGMLAAARAASTGFRIEWHEGSALALPFPDASFDAVLCQQGVQFFPDRAKGLGQMRRVLVPGGRLVVSCWRSVEHQPGMRALEEAMVRRLGPQAASLPPLSLGDRETLRGLIAGAGFRDVRIRAEVRTARYVSADRFVRMRIEGAPTMAGALRDAGPDAVADIVTDVEARLRDYLDDAGLAFPQAAHVATAVA